MPLPVALVCFAIGLAATLSQFRHVRDLPTRALLLFMWARLSIAGLPEITAKPLLAGQSIAALSTLAFTATLLLVCRTRDFRARHYALYLPLVAIFVVSAGFNGGGAIKGLVNELIAWTLFGVVLNLASASIARHGMDRTMRALLATLTVPALMQLASIPLGVVIGSELDGSIGYIGGYIHEAVFSRIMLTFLVAAVFVRWRNRFVRLALVLYAGVSIFLSNYRTTILAIAPVTALTMAAVFLRAFAARYRAAVAMTVVVVGLTGVAVAIPFLPERYATILDVVSRADELIQPSVSFSKEERGLFSYRLFLWTQYVEGHLAGDPVKRFVGHGPFAYDGRFITNAHNSFVSYLYEYGLFGAIYLLIVMTTNLFRSFRAPDLEERLTLLALHGGFIVLNLSTAVMKNVEGLVLYAVIMAGTLAWTRRPATLRRAPDVAPRPSSRAAPNVNVASRAPPAVP